MFKNRKAYDPWEPDVDEPEDELGVLVLVEDDVDLLSDVVLLSDVDDASEEAAGLPPSPAGFLA
jgi:hypothetical protein